MPNFFFSLYFLINLLPEISHSSLSGLKIESNVLLLQPFKKVSGALFNSSLFFIGSSYTFGGSLSLGALRRRIFIIISDNYKD